MYFESDGLYHIFNRGNNGNLIFFTRENYLFFLNKMKEHLNPYVNIIAWCLMPNHFHILIEVIHSLTLTDSMTRIHRISKERSLNESIAIMLRSYTRAVNKQENRRGSLFQQHTKAVCLNETELSPAYFSTRFGTIGNVTVTEFEYPNVCFNYIHGNPINHGFVKNPEEWEFSSYRDYYCDRKGKLVNRERAMELGFISAI